MFFLFTNHLRRAGVGVGLALLFGACFLFSPGGTQPAATEREDLLATRVALALTQTAVAAPPSPTATSVPLPTSTSPPPPTPSPVPLSPTSVPTFPPPPSDAPCGSPLPPGSAAPTWGDWASYRGYRTLDRVLSDTAYEGFLLDYENLWGGRGFAVEVYREVEPGHLVFFVLRRVCRAGDQTYWEVTDVLVVPKPGRNQAVLLTPFRYHFYTRFFEPARESMGLMGAFLGIECATPPAPFTLVTVQVDPATLPPVIDVDTRLPVQVRQAWRLDLERTQRFHALPSYLFEACEVRFGWR